MKKIIIFDTAIATSNLGDEIILNAIYDNMAEIFDKGTYFEDGVIKKYIPGWQKFSYDNIPINVIYKESKYHFEIITKEEYNKELILFFDWAKNQLIK